MHTALRLLDVRVTRGGREVLAVPDLRVAAGRVTIVEGDNGAGKSTLLLAAAGLLDLAQGRIDLFGKPFHTGKAPAPRAARRQLALVLQEPWLPRGTVRAFLTMVRRIHGAERPDTAALWTALGINDLMSRRTRSLSGGERRLVGLAAALQLSVPLLLLDEVSAGLDAAGAARLEALLLRETSQRGIAVLMTTHDTAMAARMDATRLHLQQGQPRVAPKPGVQPHPLAHERPRIPVAPSGQEG